MDVIMNKEQVKAIITEYINDSTVKYAVMIDGDWGSGKTYLCKEMMEKRGRDGKRWAYVSLYGVKSISDIAKKMFFQIFGEKYSSLVKGSGTAFNMLANIFTMTIDQKINLDFSKIVKQLENIDLKKGLFVLTIWKDVKSQ